MPLQIIRQDITKMHVDAIVNTTNEEMVGYSGVDLAVHTIAGKKLDRKCAELAPLGIGQAKITAGYRLPCKYVIHTACPIWQGGLAGESMLLRSCYLESLKLAVSHGCRSVAVPLMSAGNLEDQPLKFAVQTIAEFLLENELMVCLCLHDKESYSFSSKLFDDIRTFIGEEYDGEYEEEHEGKSDKAHAAEFCEAYGGDAQRSKRYVSHRMDSECRAASESCSSPSEAQTLKDYLRQLDRSFSEMLFDLIDKSGMTDVECYKKANVDKRTFSKIKSNKNYRPSKQTAIAFAISLGLDLDETQALLATVGFTLSKSNVFDKIIRYFIYNKNYDIFEINEALFEFDQVLLGSF